MESFFFFFNQLPPLSFTAGKGKKKPGKYWNHESSFALIGKVCRLEIRELRTKC